jgi:hypothetical protein
MSNVTRDSYRAALICAVIILGLVFDQFVPFWGQTLTSAGVWALLLYWIFTAQREQRMTLITCVSYATLGECFLSLAWGLYDYRLGNIPAFVPPGHALLFILGTMITIYAVCDLPGADRCGYLCCGDVCHTAHMHGVFARAQALCSDVCAGTGNGNLWHSPR